MFLQIINAQSYSDLSTKPLGRIRYNLSACGCICKVCTELGALRNLGSLPYII